MNPNIEPPITLESRGGSLSKKFSRRDAIRIFSGASAAALLTLAPERPAFAQGLVYSGIRQFAEEINASDPIEIAKSVTDAPPAKPISEDLLCVEEDGRWIVENPACGPEPIDEGRNPGALVAPAIAIEPREAPSPVPAAKPTGGPTPEQIANRERYLAELPGRFKNLEFLPNPLKGKSPAFDSEVEPTRKALGEVLLIAAQLGAADTVEIIFKANSSKPKYKRQFSQYSWGGLVLEPSDQFSSDDPLAFYMSVQILSESTIMPNQNFLEPIIRAKPFSKGVNNMWAFANFYMVAKRTQYNAEMIDQRRASGFSVVTVAEDYANGTTGILPMWKACKDFVAFANTHHNQFVSQGLGENSVVTSLINNWNNANDMTNEEGRLLRLRSLLRYWNVRFTENDLEPSTLSQLN